jgi:hypothetical protein
LQKDYNWGMAENAILKALRRPSLLAQASLPPIEEEVDSSLWEGLGTAALSGISRVANVLDLPGSSVRDLLGGENPIDQWAPWNWTTSEGRISGRDLLRKARLVSDEDTWGNFFGGMAAEIALDPTTFLSGGALLKSAAAGLRGGTKAAKAGSGLLKFSIPFVKDSATELFTGPLAQKTAGVFGAAARKVGESRPMLAFNQLFDASVAGMRTALTQKHARKMTEEIAAGHADIQGVGQGLARKLETEGLEIPPEPLNVWTEKPDGSESYSNLFNIKKTPAGSFDLGDGTRSYGEFADLPAAKQAADDIVLRDRQNPYAFLDLTDDDVVRRFQELPENKVVEGMTIEEISAVRDRVNRFEADLPNLRSDASTSAEFIARHFGNAAAAEHLYSLPTINDAIANALKMDPDRFGESITLDHAQSLEAASRAFPEARREFMYGLSELAEHLSTIQEPIVREAEAIERLGELRNEVMAMVEAGEFEPWMPPESEWITGPEAKSHETAIKLQRQIERPDAQKGQLAKTYNQITNAEITKDEHWGIPAHELRDQVKAGALGYAPRHLNPKLLESMKGKRGLLPSSSRRIMGARDAHDLSRSQTLKGFDDGTTGVNRLFAHKPLADTLEPIRKEFKIERQAANAPPEKLNEIRERALNAGADRIQADFGNEIQRHYQPERTDGARLYDNKGNKEWHMPSKAEGMIPVTRDRYKELAAIAFDHPEWLEHEIFTMHPIVSLEQMQLSGVSRRAAARMIYNSISESALDPVMALDTKFKSMEVSEIIQKLEFKQDTAVERIAEIMGVTDLDAAKRREILRMRVPEAEAEAMLEAWPTYRLPKESGLLLDSIDSMNSLFKAGVLTWPARFVRDAVSGAVRNFENGWLTSRGVLDANNLLQGRVLKGYTQSQPVIDWLNANKLEHTDENATEALRRMYAQHRGLLSHPEMDLLDQSQNVDPGLESILERVPGRHPTNEIESAKNAFKAATFQAPGTTANPLSIRGVGGAKKSAFGPAVAGDLVGQYVDNMNRLSAFLYKVGELGEDPAQAMAEIMRAQVNYSSSQFTSFEKSVMKRLFPFYSFMKSQLPYVATELLDKPGGRLRQEIRFMSGLRGEDPSVPDYIGNTASIPLGSLPDGSKRFITGLGLMHEDPLGFVDSPQGVGLELLSRTSPAIKAPLEFVTGQSFFQRGVEGGRALEDLDPVVGRTLANVASYFGRKSDRPVPTPQLLELAVSNSPLARAATTARTLTDPRKGVGARALNTLSGFRVSDVSPAAQERALERQAAAEIRRRGGRTFERPYFPEERLEGMSGTQRQLAEKLLELEQLISERRQARSAAQ